MITVIFGEMGVGKTYLGQLLAKEAGIRYVEGDDFLPQAQQLKLRRGLPLTVSDIDDYVINGLIPEMEKIAKEQKSFIISQALYFKRHRDLITATFGKKNVRFVWLPVPIFGIWKQIKQLHRRPRSIFWIIRALISKAWFEKPTNVFEVNNFAPEPYDHLNHLIQMIRDDLANDEII